MYGKELEKEGWITFASKQSRKRKFTQEEIDDIVFKSYGFMMKMGKGETNKKLAERFHDIYKRNPNYENPSYKEKID